MRGLFTASAPTPVFARASLNIEQLGVYPMRLPPLDVNRYSDDGLSLTPMYFPIAVMTLPSTGTSLLLWNLPSRTVSTLAPLSTSLSLRFSTSPIRMPVAARIPMRHCHLNARSAAQSQSLRNGYSISVRISSFE